MQRVWEFRTETCKVARNPCGGGGQGAGVISLAGQRETATPITQDCRFGERASCANTVRAAQSHCCPTPAGGGTAASGGEGEVLARSERAICEGGSGED